MRALVVGNGSDFDPGFVGQRLREHGYAFVEAHRERPGEWPDLAGIDLVVLLGSEWNVYRDETAPLVAAEAALVRAAATHGRPLLGICFGAQVISHALGGDVTRIAEPEIGWYELEPLAGCPADAVAGPWMQWHYDTFTVPAGFTELARTSAGPQLVRGGRALATQFHPECTETMVARWLRSGGADQHRAAGGDPTELLARTRELVVSSAPRAAALVDWFLADVAAIRPGPGWEGIHKSW